MRKALLLSIIAIFWATTTFAQWTSLPYLVTGTDTATTVFHFTGSASTIYACTNKGLFAGANNGDTWTNLTYTKANTMNLSIRSVYLDSVTGKLYAGGDSALFVSSDNGSTWSSTAIAHLSGRVNYIKRSGNNLLIAFGSFGTGGVYYSSNDFGTATLSSLDSIPMDDFETVGTDLFVSGKYGVYKSTDNGVTWGQNGSGFPAQSRFFFLTRSGSSFFAGDVTGNGLFRSTDNGLTWADPDTAVFHAFCQVFSVASANGSILTAMDGVCNVNEPIKISTDDGLSWAPYMTGLAPNYYSVVGRNNSGSCFFTFNNNTHVPFRVCTTTGITGDANTSASAWLSPNPAHSSLTIHTGDSKSSEIKLISITGQTVYENALNGRDKAQIDVSALPSGVYLVQIKTESSNTTLKFIKE